MTVEITSRDDLEKTYVQGDLLDVVNGMNMAASNGRKFYVTEEEGGGNVAIDLSNITKMRDRASDHALSW
jgi:hypothetical protein